MVLLTLMQRMGVEPILCICVWLPLLLLFSKVQMQTLTLSVNWPLTLIYPYWCTVEPILISHCIVRPHVFLINLCIRRLDDIVL